MTRASFHITHPNPASSSYSYVFETHAISLIRPLPTALPSSNKNRVLFVRIIFFI